MASKEFREEVQGLIGERPPWAMEIRTQRLRLRQFRNADLEPFAEMMGDAATMRYINDGSPLSREDAWRKMAYLVGHWGLHGFGPWAVEDLHTHQFLGRVGLYYPEGWPGIEVGWMIHPRHAGHGIATEAALFALYFAFEGMEVNELISIIHPDNAASIRVAEKIGGFRDREERVRGQDAVIYRYTPESTAKVAAEI